MTWCREKKYWLSSQTVETNIAFGQNQWWLPLVHFKQYRQCTMCSVNDLFHISRTGLEEEDPVFVICHINVLEGSFSDYLTKSPHFAHDKTKGQRFEPSTSNTLGTIWKSLIALVTKWFFIMVLIAYGKRYCILDLQRRFSFGTRDQSWSLKSFCVAEFY